MGDKINLDFIGAIADGSTAIKIGGSLDTPVKLTIEIPATQANLEVIAGLALLRERLLHIELETIE